MDYSVVRVNLDLYKITILPRTENENEFMRRPIPEITDQLRQHFDQAVKNWLGEKSEIISVVNDSGLPNEILALVSIGDPTE